MTTTQPINISLIKERIKKLTRCVTDIQALTDECRYFDAADCEQLIKSFIWSGKDTCTGFFLNACTVNEILIDPSLLAEALTVSEPVGDLPYLYKFQDESASAAKASGP